MVASTTRDRIQSCLNDVDFPATKDELLRCIERNRCDDETARALHGIPAETYRNLDQICSSVTIVDGDAMDEAEKARARGSHTKPGLSETAKDVGVENPIVEELGENRGS